MTRASARARGDQRRVLWKSGQTGNQWNLLMAASTISVIPSALIVILLQRYLVSGIALSGMGGR